MFREIVVKNADISQFETTQVFYTSRDKSSDKECQVPMFIVHRKVAVVTMPNIIIIIIIIVILIVTVSATHPTKFFNGISRLAFFRPGKSRKMTSVLGSGGRWHHGAVAERRSCDREVVGLSLGRACGVKTLGKFLTPMCLCHQAV